MSWEVVLVSLGGPGKITYIADQRGQINLQVLRRITDLSPKDVLASIVS